MRGQALQAGSGQARQWRSIRDGKARPAVKRLLGSWINDPVLLATFFNQYEGDSRVPARATEQFLTRSPLLSMGRSLRDRVLWEWRSGNPPLTLDRLYEMARELSGHAGMRAARCCCATTSRRRSRGGGTAIIRDRVPAVPDTYCDGKKVWTPAVIHWE